jgi:hypothetical protein
MSLPATLRLVLVMDIGERFNCKAPRSKPGELELPKAKTATGVWLSFGCLLCLPKACHNWTSGVLRSTTQLSSGLDISLVPVPITSNCIDESSSLSYHTPYFRSSQAVGAYHPQTCCHCIFQRIPMPQYEGVQFAGYRYLRLRFGACCEPI